MMDDPNNNRKMSEQKMDCLLQQGFPSGLANAVFRYCKEAFPIRFWVMDNSGSMISCDGRKLVETKQRNHVKWVDCSRWEELKECVKYHAQMAAHLEFQTQFTFLNTNTVSAGGHSYYGISEMGPDMIEEELESLLREISRTYPSGATPLEQRLNEIYTRIAPIAASLRKAGQKVVVCLATDGLPTDERGYQSDDIRSSFETALRRLMQDMPVWMVIRLCTSEEAVIQFYQNLDEQLECNIEVLDDYLDEAKEIYQHNPWITYGLSLHRCREMGFHNRLLDLLDERSLTLDEVVEFLRLVFGERSISSDPHMDWDDFLREIKTQLLAKEDLTYNALRRKLTPWVDVSQLERKYGPWKLRINWYLIFTVILIAFLVRRYYLL